MREGVASGRYFPPVSSDIEIDLEQRQRAQGLALTVLQVMPQGRASRRDLVLLPVPCGIEGQTGPKTTRLPLGDIVSEGS